MIDSTTLNSFTLTGLALNILTQNADGQAAMDCGQLWAEFQNGDYPARIPGKLDHEIFAVYHNYTGDHTKPFAFFIGCRVTPGSMVPEGMTGIKIEKANYQVYVAKGRMPDCVVNTWKQIWDSPAQRSYRADFELYDDKSRDWNNAEVRIFIGVKE